MTIHNTIAILIAVLLSCLVIIYCGRIMYRLGVRDGYQNPFIPSVQAIIKQDDLKQYPIGRLDGAAALINAARGLVEYRDLSGPLNFQLEKADTFIFRMRVALDAMGKPSKPE